MSTTDFTTEMLSSSAPSLKFAQEGDTVSIVVETLVKQQETAFGTGEPVTWADGRPKYQWLVTGTSGGEEARLYIKGYMVDALKEALRKADVYAGQNIEGWKLTVKWASTEKPRMAGMQGARKYVAKFERGSKGIVDQDLI
jgi:hypothetical protein